jgi:type I restriction enzyme S subunit
MKLETFFEHFDLLAEAPNAVQKLRELILDLAVRGKLVPQDANDEPAAVLLERIKKEKERLVKEGKVSKLESLPAIKDDETPFDLPISWEWVYLGQISYTIHYGYTASANQNLTEVRLLRITDIQNNKVNWETVPGCEIDDNKLEGYKLNNGDLLIARTGGTIGKSYLVENLSICAVFASYLIRVIPSYLTFPNYLKIFLESQTYWSQLYAKSMGTGQPNVNATSLKSLFVPFPPLAEQKRIVTKVDELMKLCDELEARQKKKRETRILINNAALNKLLTADTPETFTKNWQRIGDNFDILYSAPENIGKLRQAILQLAVMGKLVPQDANDEPAAVLLERIKKEKERLIKEGKIKKEKSLPEIIADELEYNIPQQWAWSRLTDICELITDGTHQTPNYTDTGRIFLSAQNVKPFRFMPEVHRFVSEADYQGYIKSRKPEFEDILLTRVGAGIGEGAVIDQKLDFAIYVSVALIRPVKKFIDPYYLTIWLNSPSGTHKSSINTYGKGVSQGNLNLGLIRKFIVSLPPYQEQKRIVTKVDKLMKLCDELETKLTQTQTESEKIINAAVKQLLTV